ncbi:signal recognition particle receptor subunit alpha, partial [Candidatus Woesearchaeota archaeon]|nr:signal recognition particle receptor subunit alpha [Candidatus Woesearchaeota archaeon]
MFKFLKEKLKSAISRISENVEKSAIEEKPAEEAEEEKGFFAKLKEKFTGKEEEKIVLEDKKPVIKEKIEVNREEEPKVSHKKIEEQAIKPLAKKIEETSKTIEKEPEKKGFFKAITEKITTTKISEGQFEKLFWDLELALMESNVAVEVIEKIKNDLKEQLVEKPITRTKVEDTIVLTLKSSIQDLFQNNHIDLIQEIKNKKEKPYIIAFFGINGSGKTTSIAKLANMLKEKKISSVLAASDTFRAASIEQLQQHADKLGIKMIKHDYGSDPAAVAFDAIKHAKAKSIDAVLIDTAGRMHSN